MVIDRGAADHVDEAILDRYRTDELPAAERRRVAAHIEACTECRTRFDSLAAFAAAVSGAYETGADEERDWARQRAVIAARTWGRRPAGERARGSGLWRFAPQVAAAAVAVLVVGVLVREGVRGPAEAERIAEDAFRPARAIEEAMISEDRTDRPDRDRPVGDRENAVPAAAHGAAPPVAEQTVRAQAEPTLADRPAAPPVDEKADLQSKRERRPAGEDVRADDRFEVDALEAEPALEDPVARFVSMARRALGTRDSLAVEAALIYWRDSLDVPPDRQAAPVAALVDSLRGFRP